MTSQHDHNLPNLLGNKAYPALTWRPEYARPGLPLGVLQAVVAGCTDQGMGFLHKVLRGTMKYWMGFH